MLIENLLNFPKFEIVLILICIAGILASGNRAQTFWRFVSCAFTYVLMFELYINLMREIQLSSEQFQSGVYSLPFFEELKAVTTEPILIKGEFGNFIYELLKLFIFCLIVDTAFIISKPILDWCSKISNTVAAFLISAFARYLVCCLALIAQMFLWIYVLSGIPQNIFTVLAYIVFLAMILMMLTPVVNFILLAAKVTKDTTIGKFVSSLSEFVKENKMSGELKTSFFCTFLMVLLLSVLRRTGALLSLAEQIQEVAFLNF